MTAAADLITSTATQPKRRAITFEVRAVDDGTVIEIIDRKTAKPLFVAIPQEV